MSRKKVGQMAFYALEKLHQLHEGYCRSFKVAGQQLLLIENDGKRYLIENRCPHMDAPLDRATFSPGRLRCPVHGVEFQLNDGAALGSLAGCIDGLKSHTLAYDGNTIGVEL